MTEQHPLTDDIIEEITRFDPDADDMRAAADWQLERDAEELENILLEIILPPAVDLIVERFKRTMRPTTTQEDN